MDEELIAALEAEKANYLKQGQKDRAAEVDRQLAFHRGEFPKPVAAAKKAAPAKAKTRKRTDVETAVEK